MSQPTIYLVQGLFWQDKLTYGIGQKPSLGQAEYATRGLHHSLFSGVIAPPPTNPEAPLEGALQDNYGESTLSDVILTEEKLEFTKKYDHRSNEVRYTFNKKVAGFWIGAWEGSDVGTGFAKCVIMPVGPDYFDPASTAKQLGITLR